MPHTGLKALLRLPIGWSVIVVLESIFTDFSPRKAKETLLLARNRRIRERFALGESTQNLAREFGISRQRVYQIMHGQ